MFTQHMFLTHYVKVTWLVFSSNVASTGKYNLSPSASEMHNSSSVYLFGKGQLVRQMEDLSTGTNISSWDLQWEHN